MKKPLTPMHADPDEPQSVRELLEAGMTAPVDYDLQRGLAKHQALIAAGAPVPPWAGEAAMQGSGVGASVIGWIVGSVVAVGVVTGVTVMGLREPDKQITAQVIVPSAPTVVQRDPGVVSAHMGEGGASEPGLPPEVVPAPSERPTRGGFRGSMPSPSSARADGAASRRSAAAKRGHGTGTRSARTADEASSSTVPEPAAASVGTGQATRGSGTPAAIGVQSTPGTGVAAVAPESASASRSADKAGVDVPVPEERKPSEAAVAADEVSEESPLDRWRRGAMADDPSDVAEARLEREMRMLKVAQANLSTNPARALSLARKGEQEFADSMFAQERQHVLILALVELGRLDEARRRAADYLKRYPRGPFSDRVRKALAAHAATH